MKFDKYSFPHPILGRGDDISGNASVTLGIDEEADAENFTVSLKYFVDNQDILTFIEQGVANFYCEITCSATLFRATVMGPEPIKIFTIEKNAVRGKVELLFLIVVSEPINGYLNSQVHPELEGLATDLDSGDVLAYLGESDFLADISFKKLKAASSFMEVVEGEKQVGTFEVVLDNPKILVRLSKLDFAMYTKPEIGKNEQLASVFQSSVALPALVNALQQLSLPTGEDDYGETAWAKAIRWRMEHEPEFTGMVLDQERVLHIAQTLLGSPVERLLSDIERRSNERTDEDN